MNSERAGKLCALLASSTLLLAAAVVGGCADSGNEDVATSEAAITTELDWVYTLPAGDPGVKDPYDVYNVCRGKYNGVWHPGKVHQSQCWIAYSDYSIRFNLNGNPGDGQFLRGNGTYRYRWRFMGTNPNTYYRDVEGGLEYGWPLYVCAGWVNDPIDPDSFHPGKYAPYNNRCWYAWGSGDRYDVPGSPPSGNPNVLMLQAY